MKKFIASCGAALATLFLCSQVHAAAGGQVTVDTNLAIPAAAAYSSTFAMVTNGINWGAAEVVVTSAPSVGGSFYSGSASTGNLTVVSYLALSTASATGNITISSDTATVGTCISGGGPQFGSFNVCNPANFAVDLNYSSNTAKNIATAINAFGVVTATSGLVGGVVYTTAPVGSIGNSFTLSVSSYGAYTLSTFVSSQPFQVGYASMTGYGFGKLTGGQDNQTFSINGQVFTANAQGAFGFFPVTSTAQTATNIATAINNSSNTIGVIANAGTSSTTVVFATATVNGSNTNYVITSSSNAALSLSGTVTLTNGGPLNLPTIGTSALSGGTTAGFLVGTSTISLAGNSFGQGEAVYLSTTSGNTVTPLIGGVTYYVMDIPPNVTGPQIMLATTQTNALNNVPIVLTSSGVVNGTPTSYGLTATALAGTPSFQWMVSDDGVHYAAFTTNVFGQSIGSFGGYGTYVTTGTISSFDFGHVDHGWLGLQMTAPTGGAITVNAAVTGKQN